MIKYNKLFLIINLILFNFALATDAPIEPSLYQQVGQLVLDGENYFTQPNVKLENALSLKIDQNIPEETSDHFKKKEKKAAKMTLKLSSSDRKKIVFSLYHDFGILKDNHKVIKPYTAQELNITIGLDYSKETSLYKKIDRTNTTFGTAVLATNLSNPLSNEEDIINRQNAIKYLVDNREILNQLDLLLKDMIPHENGLLNYYNPSANLAPELFDMIYWPKNSYSIFKILNKSTNWRSFWGKFDEITYVAHPVFDALRNMSFLFTAIIACGFHQYISDKQYLRESFLTWFKTGLIVMAKDPDTPKIFGGLGAITFVYRALYYVQSIQHFKILRSIYKGLDQRTRDVSHIYKSLNKLYNIINQIPELKQACEKWSNLEKFINNKFCDNKKILDNMKKLKTLLDNKVFDKDFNWFSNTGVIQTAHIYITELKDYFVKALEALGEIDAYVSIAKLFNEYKNKDLRYCFVNIIHTNVPYVNVMDAWCPLIGEKSQPISIEFGGSNLPNKLMITGPHGGGKSTLERTIAHNKILNQSYGIASAKQATLSVEHKIGSFMNVKEDISKGKSKFMAERDRVIELVKDIQSSSEQNKKIIIFMDEVYSGTMEDQGALMLFNFAKKMAQFPNYMLIIATHFKEHVHSLESLYPKFFKNYHFEIQEMNNKFIRSYELKEGRCEWWFADPERRNRYIEQLATEEQTGLFQKLN